MRGLGMKSGGPDRCTHFTRPILHRIFHPAFHVHSQEELMQAEMLIKFPPVASMGTYCWARCSSGQWNIPTGTWNSWCATIFQISQAWVRVELGTLCRSDQEGVCVGNKGFGAAARAGLCGLVFVVGTHRLMERALLLLSPESLWETHKKGRKAFQGEK